MYVLTEMLQSTETFFRKLRDSGGVDENSFQMKSKDKASWDWAAGTMNQPVERGRDLSLKASWLT